MPGLARIRAAGNDGYDNKTGRRVHCSLNFHYDY
jgi:hypothetical protein